MLGYPIEIALKIETQRKNVQSGFLETRISRISHALCFESRHKQQHVVGATKLKLHGSFQ